MKEKIFPKMNRIHIVEEMKEKWPFLKGDIRNLNTISDKFIYMIEAGVPLADINIKSNGSFANFEIVKLRTVSDTLLEDAVKGVKDIVNAGMYKEPHEKIKQLGLDLEIKMEALVALSESTPTLAIKNARKEDIQSILQDQKENTKLLSGNDMGVPK